MYKEALVVNACCRAFSNRSDGNGKGHDPSLITLDRNCCTTVRGDFFTQKRSGRGCLD